jgi:hypothetical protein
MQFRKIKTATALLAVAAGVSAFAGSAQAAVVDNDGFSILGDSEVTLTDANLAYDWSHSTVTPRVTGTLTMVNGDDACFRVRADSYDRSGTLIGTAYDDPNGHCRHKDAEKDRAIDMSAPAAPYVQQVIVSLEKKGNEDWKTRGQNNTSLLTMHDDNVTVLGSGVDVGSMGFYAGDPTGPAKVHWAIGDDGRLTGSSDTWLHFDGFGRYGRVMIRALNNAGKVQDKQAGPDRIPKDNGHWYYEDKLSVTSEDSVRLSVVMQTQLGTDSNGDPTYQDAGAETVSVAE